MLERIDHESVAELRLNRPEVRNALNDELIGALGGAVAELSAAPPRAVLLSGAGSVFCAGADLEWMQRSAQLSRDENVIQTLTLADTLAALAALPCPVVARVQGGAYGGGLGLLACCDVVVAAADCRFSFGEVRLGLSPATIAPFVLAKIGASAARELMLTARRFDAAEAQRIGLVHRICPAAELDATVQRVISELLSGGPQAQAETKRLLRELARGETADVRARTAELIADLRASAEGQEGLEAFLEKRPPSWQQG